MDVHKNARRSCLSVIDSLILTKQIRAKIYLLQNDPEELLRLYRQDFPVELH